MTGSETHAEVMLVDDDERRARDLADALTSAGFCVAVKRLGTDAFMSARQHPPDALVAATALSDLDGYVLCSLFRCDPTLAPVPVVLVIRDAVDSEQRALAACAGAAALVEHTSTSTAEIEALRAALARGVPPMHDTDACGHLRKTMVAYLGDLLSRTRRAEARYRALFDTAQDAIALTTPDGMFLDVSRAWENLRQVPRDRIVGTHIRDSVVAEHQTDAVADYARLVGAGGGRSTVVPVARADGTHLHIQFSTARARIDGEDVVFSIGRDVTQAVLAHRELEASERRYRLLIENTPDVVWVAALDGRCIFISPNVTAVCGFTPDEIIAGGPSFWLDRTHSADVDGLREAYTRLADGHPYQAEYRWRRKDGEWIWLRSKAIPARGPDGDRYAEGTFTDVSEFKRMGEQVRQSQKMEAIGQLTGGIAHDFNNLLAVILGNGRLLLDELHQHDPRRADALAVIEAGERAAALTRQLLMFSRRQVVRPASIDVNGVVSGLEQILRRLIGEDVKLELHLADTPGVVLADPGEIEQIVVNLAVNARDAMPGGGHLSISTRHTDLDKEYAALHHGVVPGPYVMLTVTDDGCGMDAATQQRIFEPFFTTKDKGHGTGLGLSTCWAIVNHAKGHIAVYSEPGHGSSFKVYLPQIDSRPAAAPPVDIDDGRGTGTILLVEDDKALRATIHRTLAARGYGVLDAADGREAIRIAETHPDPIDLVLCDMVMPGLNGPDTVDEVRRRRPETAVLFMSGYSDHPLLRSGSASQVDFIQKPFAPAALAHQINGALLKARAEANVLPKAPI